MKRNYRLVLAVWLLPAVLWTASCRAQDGERPAAAAPAEGSPTSPAPVEREPTTATARSLPTAVPTSVITATIPLPAVTTAPTVEPTRPALGSPARPVQLLFPPVAPGVVITRRAEPLLAALRAATGAEFAVGLADNEAALVELLCAAPADVVGFVSAAAYTLAEEQCDARAGLVAVHEDGLTWEMGMLVTRPGEADELADLAEQRWAVADRRSLPHYLYFRAQMAAAGIEPGAIVDAPEESSALLSLLEDEADFTTVDFTPPIMPAGREWIVGETQPEVWRALGIPPSRSPIGYVIVAGEPEFGGYRLRDARARLFDTTPEIFNETRVLSLSEPIPNETVIYGADLPPGLAQELLTTMTEFVASDACGESLCSADLFGWIGLEPAEDAAYDPIRAIKDTLELEAADLWAELD
jgi:phosphonate transport system substrate-binding protein